MRRVSFIAIFLWFAGCGDIVGLVVDYPCCDTETLDTSTETESASIPEEESEAGTDTDETSALPPFLIGADLSWVEEQEDLGAVFTENGEETDIFALLKAHGFNAVRLRLFYDPGRPNGYQFAFGADRAEPYCDLPHTLGMSKRIKDADMAFMLNFHYSDTWADPGAQAKPSAFADLSFDALRGALHDYTRDVLIAFRAAGSLPDMVQLGNEITAGMLFPDGRTYNPDNWDYLAELLIAASEAVREVDPAIRIAVHLDKGGDYDSTVWWVDEALSRGVTFDVLAESTYSKWQGTPDEWRANFERLAATYPKLTFLVAEYADNHREVNDILFETPRGLGTFVWEPTADGEWGEGLFDMPIGEGAATPRQTLYLYDKMAVDYGLR